LKTVENQLRPNKFKKLYFMLKPSFFLFAMLFLAFGGFGQQSERTFLITKKYLNYPIQRNPVEIKSRDIKKVKVDFILDGKRITYAEMSLATNIPDYWVFTDVSAYKGKTLTLVFDRPVDAIQKIYQSDTFWEQENLYKEKYRPQFHFSSRRGWNNDPNGLVYLDGEYHLYYQHNPYDIKHGNLAWGHAVSRDLVHWNELPVTLMPDELGTMNSGSAVVDKNNTSGWGKNVLVAAYTTFNMLERKPAQCVAYSTDKGRTFTKYDKNPVIDSKAQTAARDPKVFWYAPSNGWVMALYEMNGISIYTSKDLKQWKYESHTDGFFECPELFELPVDGNANHTKWVMYGASGPYMLGSFDGKKFTPEAGKYRCIFGLQYASQTFNQAPDGRRVQMGWGKIVHSPDMPFSQMMTFPTELSLRSTNEGPRLYNEPVKEIEKLHSKGFKWNDLDLADANKKLEEVKGDLIHLKMKIELLEQLKFSISYKGKKLVDFDGNKDLMNDVPYIQAVPGKLIFELELLIDKTSVEVFFDHGRRVDVLSLSDSKRSDGLNINVRNNSAIVHKLEVYELKSAWDN
jgi:fructan beta-fructosidase